MASRITRPNGHYWIQARGPEGKRKTIRLGACTLRQAEELRERIAVLESAARLGTALDPASLAWLASLPDLLYAKLVATGFAPARSLRPAATTLEQLVEKFPDSLSVKQQTATQQQMVAENLLAFFSGSRRLGDITPGDADEFQRWLTRSGRKKTPTGQQTRPLAAATVSRRCRTAKQIFAFAVRKGWIESNPFHHLKTSLESNPAGEVYVCPDLVRRLIEESPSPEFRVILALARFGGLRCPSELARLTWGQVDWEGWLRVVAPKTEHHGGGRREVPLSPEAIAALTELWEVDGSGELVLPHHGQLTGAAWTSELSRLCQRLGVPLWPRPWNNMRASCETDLLREGRDIFTTAAWLGHSPEVALRHYNRVARERSSWRVAELPPRPSGTASGMQVSGR